MSPKKKIEITDDEAEYTFFINLELKRIELILKRPFFSEELVIGENHVPDPVLIAFYKELRQLVHEYRSSQLYPK